MNQNDFYGGRASSTSARPWYRRELAAVHLMWPGLLLLGMVIAAFVIAIHNIAYLHRHHLVTKTTIDKEVYEQHLKTAAEARWLTLVVQTNGTFTVLENTTGEADSAFKVVLEDDNKRRPAGGTDAQQFAGVLVQGPTGFVSRFAPTFASALSNHCAQDRLFQYQQCIAGLSFSPDMINILVTETATNGDTIKDGTASILHSVHMRVLFKPR